MAPIVLPRGSNVEYGRGVFFPHILLVGRYVQLNSAPKGRKRMGIVIVLSVQYFKR